MIKNDVAKHDPTERLVVYGAVADDEGSAPYDLLWTQVHEFIDVCTPTTIQPCCCTAEYGWPNPGSCTLSSIPAVLGHRRWIFKVFRHRYLSALQFFVDFAGAAQL